MTKSEGVQLVSVVGNVEDHLAVGCLVVKREEFLGDQNVLLGMLISLPDINDVIQNDRIARVDLRIVEFQEVLLSLIADFLFGHGLIHVLVV